MKTKYLVIRRENLRNFLVRVTDSTIADEILREIEKTTEVVELAPGDRVVKWSDVHDALKMSNEELIKAVREVR